MICNHLTESPSLVLTNALCCVLIYDPSLYWQREKYLSKCEQRGDYSVIPAAVYLRIFQSSS